MLRSRHIPEEICTLVIAEAFPEDGGLFCCTASNPYGSINSSAQLTVTAGEFCHHQEPVAGTGLQEGTTGSQRIKQKR